MERVGAVDSAAGASIGTIAQTAIARHAHAVVHFEIETPTQAQPPSAVDCALDRPVLGLVDCRYVFIVPVTHDQRDKPHPPVGIT